MTTINLTAGDDTFTATNAGDSIFGLGGNDTITASSGGNLLNGGDGDDTLNGDDGNDTLIGDVTSNTLYHNTLNGFGGDDLITSYSYFDSIDGGDGNDGVTVYAMTTGQIVDGGADDDNIHILALSATTQPVNIVMGSTFIPTVGGINGATYTNFETLSFLGGTGASTIQGGDGDDFIAASQSNITSFDAGGLKGMGGDDRLSFHSLPNSGTGIESINGGSGIDTLTWSPGNKPGAFADLEIDGVHGKMKTGGTTFANFTNIENLSVALKFGMAGTVDYSGVTGADIVTIYGASSKVKGNDGNDSISIQTGTSNIDAGTGDDTASAAFSNTSAQTIRGGAGNDVVGGGKGVDRLYGDDGNDIVRGFNAQSSLSGGSGDDALALTNLHSGAGAGTINGGSGHDVVTLEMFATTQALNIVLGGPNVVFADGTQVLNCEAFIFTGGSGNDTLTASDDAGGNTVNKLDGYAGNDTLIASANGASLNGSLGDDMLIAGAGADILNGLTNGTAGDTASYANSAAGVTVDLTVLTAQGGGGDAAGDVLIAVENILGSALNDRLTGNTLANALTGGAGNDKLTGGLGTDILAGGGGKDTFVYTAANHSSGSGFDAVTDFDAANEFFQMITGVTGVDAKVADGTLSLASFDADLAAALSGELDASHAIVFTPDAGDQSGHVFLIVDQNGTAGYQSGGDVVVDITGVKHLSSLSGANFTT